MFMKFSLTRQPLLDRPESLLKLRIVNVVMRNNEERGFKDIAQSFV